MLKILLYFYFYFIKKLLFCTYNLYCLLVIIRLLSNVHYNFTTVCGYCYCCQFASMIAMIRYKYNIFNRGSDVVVRYYTFWIVKFLPKCC